MKSAGNDIVALSAIDIQRTISPSFYSKFITVAEQELYKQPHIAAVPFQNFAWLLWSVKESAYKFIKRSQSDLIFSPSKIIIQNIVIPQIKSSPSTTLWGNDCDTDDFYNGEVICGSNKFYFQSKITNEFIATVVNHMRNFNEVYWGVKQIDNPTQENQSQQVREFALNRLSNVLAINSLRIDKTSSGCPIITSDEQQLDVPVSLAHHAKFVAYSFCVQ